MDNFLTQDEVDALPDGSRVEVIWSGGNGPYKYVILHFDGTIYAASHTAGTLVGHVLKFIGKKPFHTRVKLCS